MLTDQLPPKNKATIADCLQWNIKALEKSYQRQNREVSGWLEEMNGKIEELRAKLNQSTPGDQRLLEEIHKYNNESVMDACNCDLARSFGMLGIRFCFDFNELDLMRIISKDAMNRRLSDIFSIPNAYASRKVCKKEKNEIKEYTKLMNEGWNREMLEKTGAISMIANMYKYIYADEQRNKSLYEIKTERGNNKWSNLVNSVMEAGRLYQEGLFDESWRSYERTYDIIINHKRDSTFNEIAKHIVRGYFDSLWDAIEQDNNVIYNEEKKQIIYNFGNSLAIDDVGLKFRLFRDKAETVMMENNLDRKYIKELDKLIIEGVELENEIKRKFNLNKDIGEAKENMAYSGKLYYKINRNRNRTVGQVKF
jgi:hypothetical protein